ncbi:MAG: hypothetical protein R3E31_18645 [Chloroflexota bacterium]
MVNGRIIRAGLERGVILADRAQPGIFAQKHILMVPVSVTTVWPKGPAQLQHSLRRSRHLLCPAPIPRRRQPHDIRSRRLALLLNNSKKPHSAVSSHNPRSRHTACRRTFQWADVLAGDIGAIRRYAPAELKRKTVVVECASEEDLQDLRQRGASILGDNDALLKRRQPGQLVSGRYRGHSRGAAPQRQCAPFTEDTYLDLMADIKWTPAVRYLQPADAGINKFAFVIHPPYQFYPQTPTFRAGPATCQMIWWNVLPPICRPFTSRALRIGAVADHRAKD